MTGFESALDGFGALAEGTGISPCGLRLAGEELFCESGSPFAPAPRAGNEINTPRHISRSGDWAENRVESALSNRFVFLFINIKIGGQQ